MHADRPNQDVVLIVDDTPGNVALLHTALEEAGYVVLVALDGRAALHSMNIRRPDLVLLDAMMPGLDGFETCRMIKSDTHLADVPVVFMTALTETEDVVRGFEAGGVDYVTKPIRSDEVLARVASHLRQSRIVSEMRCVLKQAPRATAESDGASGTPNGGDKRLRQRYGLTGREAEVLLWAAAGKTNRDIGEILGVSPRTVNKHLDHIYVKLGVETRTAAALAAAKVMNGAD